MLIGQVEGRVGVKYQIALPKKFREILGDTIVVTKGMEEYLIVLSEANWRGLLEGTQGRPFIDKTSREVQRYLLGNASVIELDRKGRFVVPEYLRRHATIEDSVLFVGIERFVEVWNTQKWEEHQALVAPQIASIAQRLSDYVKHE